ncbi:hypothetical protein PG5_32640 [Pseudomonas sp. G5(2012)]|nr:hypothetical protein PG5_32640 [Pseudomonas sp. G5(2012)]
MARIVPALEGFGNRCGLGGQSLAKMTGHLECLFRRLREQARSHRDRTQ